MREFTPETTPVTPEEQAFCERLFLLFARVSPQKPEKGVRTLLKRARLLAATEGIPLSQALDTIYQGAEERTERRVALLSTCKLREETQP